MIGANAVDDPLNRVRVGLDLANRRATLCFSPQFDSIQNQVNNLCKSIVAVVSSSFSSSSDSLLYNARLGSGH